MPIYVYTCEKCKKTYDIAQQLSEPRLSECPVCKCANFRRIITAPMVMTKSRSSRHISLGSVGEFGPEL